MPNSSNPEAADETEAQALIEQGRAGLPSAREVDDADGKDPTKTQLKAAQDLIDQGRRQLNDGLPLPGAEVVKAAEVSDSASSKAKSGD